MKKVIIVGGVAGGASTAARLRRLDEKCEIIMLERGEYISFANCGLPYYIGGVIKDRDKLLVQTPEAMKKRFNIDVRTQNEVLSIDKEARTIQILDIKTNKKYEEKYDALVLSTGSSPLKPNIKGIDAENIKTLWTIPDTDAIVNYINENNVKSATVVGGGFIGLEMVENLRELGIQVTLAEMAPQVMAPLDFEMAQYVHEELVNQGVKIYLNNGVDHFETRHGLTTTYLQDGTPLESELVILSLGIKPNSKLAKDAGLELNKRGYVVVDKHMTTSDKAIYAVGDVTEITDYNTKEKTNVALAGPANKEGRVCADNIAGIKSEYVGSQKTSVAKVFDLTVSTTGQNEKDLQKSGKVYKKDYLVSYIEPKSHAGYYPNAFPMHMKLIFALDGKVLGAQNVGYEGVEKRIDVISTLMHYNGTITDMTELDLSYAPPFGSAKDPVNMIGFASENILKGLQESARVEELKDLDLTKNTILDVRTALEVGGGEVENAVNIEVDVLRDNLDHLDKEKTIYTCCAIGLRGYVAARILSQNGFKVKNVLGGYHMYKVYNSDFTKEVVKTDNCAKNISDSGDCNISELDATGMQCPGPILLLRNKMAELNDGDMLRVRATDFGFVADAKAWCTKTGNEFLNHSKEGMIHTIDVKRKVLAPSEQASQAVNSLNGTTEVIFSGDLDKALAAMIIANGAAAMGKDVTLFFTFWGLNILRKNQHIKIKKSFIEKMFGKMMPRGTSKLTLSKMNMGGMGSKMMKSVMKKKNVLSLDELIKEAMANKVKFVACTMSMDIMGIQKEELIDGIDFGGVAAYLGATDSANHNLFI